MAHVFVDEYRLLVFPIVLGSRRRLFPETSDKTVLRLVGTKTPDSGALILTYRPGEKERERMDRSSSDVMWCCQASWRRRVLLQALRQRGGERRCRSTIVEVRGLLMTVTLSRSARHSPMSAGAHDS